MKKWIALFLAFILCFSLVACAEKSAATEPEEPAATEAEETATEAENPESAGLTKEEMLSSAQPLTREEIDKSITNVAFAKSLVGNVYTFGGEIWNVQEDHAVITFYIQDDGGNYATVANVMVANLYLPLEDLITLEHQQRFSFVGRLDDVTTHEETIPDWGTETVVDLVFKSAAIVSDRFEKTGVLHSPNTSYGNNSWNIKFPDSDYLGLVYFAEDVTSFKGEEITYSYKVTGEGCVDAYIVE